MEGVLIVFIVIGLPVVGGLAFAAFQEYLKHKRRSGDDELKKKVQELERRLEALETIVTSDDYRLFQARMREISARASKQSPASQGQPSLTEAQRNAEKGL